MTREEWMENFGENLEYILFSKKLNQRQLSDLTGMPSSTISNYIKGKTMPSAEAIVKIVYALETVKEGDVIEYFDLLDFSDTID